MASLAQLRANPGTRSKLPASKLTKGQRAQRALNARLDKPITPGSSITERALALQRKAAIQAQFAPQEQAVQQEVTQAHQNAADTSRWYDEYLNELGRHQQAAADREAKTNAAMAALMGSIQGLDQKNSQNVQQGLSADAATRGATPSAQTATDASNASVVRQAMLASLSSGLASQGQAASNYASGLAHVVGPGQKLTAQIQGQRGIDAALGKNTALRRQEAAAGTTYDADFRQNEAKNIIAGRAVDLESAQTIDPKTGQPYSYRTGHNQRVQAGHQWAANSSPQHPGVTNGAWRDWSTAKREKWLKDHSTGSAKGGARTNDKAFKEAFGVNPATGLQVKDALGGISEARGALHDLRGITTKTETPKEEWKTKGKPEYYPFAGKDLTYSQVVDKLVRSGVDSVFAHVVADQDHYRKPGYVTKGTANMLRHAGYRLESLGLHIIKSPTAAEKAIAKTITKGLTGR